MDEPSAYGVDCFQQKVHRLFPVEDRKNMKPHPVQAIHVQATLLMDGIEWLAHHVML